MMDATIASTFVVVFREALEAGLIVGIIVTMLSRLQAMRYAPPVWGGTLAAVVASVLVGWMLSVSTAATQEHWKGVIEGVISLVACGVLTWMVFWMDRQAKRLRPELETQVESAVTREEVPALVALPFLAVFREGAETALFLKAVAIQGSGSVSALGGLLGAGAAVAVTMAIFIGGRRVPLKALFRWTGGLLLLMAAGMLAYGIHELEELGWLPPIIEHVWNINHLLNEKQGLGAFLKALFGYNGNPSLLEVSAYVAYLLGVSWFLKRTIQVSPTA
ncbi:MAG: FTR1 family protein [Candidatus Omnitrophica bacterium]|nr:FTR1 family protein [Candidatus Omnitrophota bacterium]